MIDALMAADLSNLHLILCLAGGLAAVYVMQLTRYEDEDHLDPWLVREANRVTLALIALAMFACALYQLHTGWHPWPTQVLLVTAMDVKLLTRVAAIKSRVRRTGHRGLSALLRARRH